MNTIKKDLFDLFEIDKMPPEKGNEMLERLAKLVFQAVLIRSLPLLSEEDIQEYEKTVNSSQEGDALFNFLSQKVPEFNKIVSEEAGALRRQVSKKMVEN